MNEEENVKTTEKTPVKKWQGTIPYDAPYSFVVLVLGYWGRGSNVKAAAEQCRKSGATRKDIINLKLVVGDATPEVNDQGCLLHDPGSIVIGVIYPSEGMTLGTLLKLKG